MHTRLISTVLFLAAAACSRDTARDGANTARDRETSAPVDLSRSGQRVPPSSTYGTGDSSERPSGQPGTADTGASAQSTGYTTTGPMGEGPGGWSAGTTSAAGNQGIPTTEPNPNVATNNNAKQQPATGGGAYTFGATAPSAATAMSCEQLVPASVRDQIRPGLTVASTSANAGTTADTTTTRTTEAHAQMETSCELQGAGLTQPVAIKADCPQQQATGVATNMKAPGARKVQLGKGGMLEQQGDVSHLTAVDANSNCRIDVTVPKDVDAVAIGQAVLDQLPPAG